MKNVWNRLAIAYKIFLALLFFVLIGQFVLMVWIWHNESGILILKERENLKGELSFHAENLQKHLALLEKENTFLASLEVMDDIVAKDIDKRVETLIARKAEDLGEGIVFVARYHDRAVASSREEFLIEDKRLWQARYLIFDARILASYSEKKDIGVLSLLYPFENLVNLQLKDSAKKLWLQPNCDVKGFKMAIPSDSIVVSQSLSGALKGWKLSLFYDKSQALLTLKHIEKVLIYTFLFSIMMLGLVVWFLSKKLTNPIHALLTTSEEIISTKDYSKQVQVDSQDEVGQLATSFNTLIHKTDTYIKLLQGTQAALDTKSTFLSTMSHELKTPLGSILSLTQHIMINPNITDEQSDMLRRIEISAEHLLGMINNILQLSKLESKSIQIHKEHINLKTVLEEICDMVEPLAEEKNLYLHTALLDRVIVSDSNLFKQVVINLLSNAIKFTQEGGVRLSVKEGDGMFTLEVEDTGMGIDKAKQAQLFTEFYQANVDMQSGSGLGLALAQKVAGLIEGTIMIESQGIGKGTKAVFTFKSI